MKPLSLLALWSFLTAGLVAGCGASQLSVGKDDLDAGDTDAEAQPAVEAGSEATVSVDGSSGCHTDNDCPSVGPDICNICAPPLNHYVCQAGACVCACQLPSDGGSTCTPPQDAGSTGVSCVASRDCPAGQICGYPICDACNAHGFCFPQGPLCNGFSPGCACNGGGGPPTVVNIACNGLPDGYAPEPIQYAGYCKDFTCGSMTCTTGQFCEYEVLRDPPASYYCVSIPSACANTPTCDCILQSMAPSGFCGPTTGGTCSEMNGHPYVTCTQM